MIAEHKLDYVPASADLADFDPSSTAIAHRARRRARPPAARPRRRGRLQRYYEELEKRRRGTTDWELYSPYELRAAGALMRLGQREQALSVIEDMLADRRPLAWNQWAEVVWQRSRQRRSSSATCRIPGRRRIYPSRARSLCLRARGRRFPGHRRGNPANWVTADAPIGVRRMPTHYGILSYELRRDGPNALHLQISGDLNVPPGGFCSATAASRRAEVRYRRRPGNPLRSAASTHLPLPRRRRSTILAPWDRGRPARSGKDLATDHTDGKSPRPHARSFDVRN